MFRLNYGVFRVCEQFLNDIRASSDNRDLEKVVIPSNPTTNALRILEQLRNIVDELDRGDTDSFYRTFPVELDPFSHPEAQGNGSQWSQEVLRNAGITPELANPKTFGHPEIKGIIYTDVDGTVSNHKTFTPETSLRHALFVAEAAKEGYVVIPVTGSAMGDGEGVTNMKDRFLHGEMLATPVVCTRGGSEAWVLESERYRQFEPYAKMMEELRAAVTLDQWTNLVAAISGIVESEITKAFGANWTKDIENVQHFNDRSHQLGRLGSNESVETIASIKVQPHTRLEEAPGTGSVNFYVTVPNTGAPEQVMNSISAKIKSFLDEQGYASNLASFRGIEDNFGTDGPVLQYFLDFSVYQKSTARVIQGHLERLLCIPVAQNPTIHFAGNGNNDAFFVHNWGPDRGEPGAFLIQPDREAKSLAKSIISSGWSGRVVLMGGEDPLCSRLLRNFTRLISESSHL
jgi:hypothetical protein